MARRRAIVVVLVVLAVCVFGIWVGWRPSSSTPPQVVSTPRVRVVYLAFSTAALPIKIAQQRFAAANGIEIEMGTAAKGGLALQAVQDGVEFEATGGLGDQPWLDAVAEGHRETVAYMQLLTSVDEPFDAFIARAGTAFASVRDLKGRRVGLLASPHLRVHFDIALEAAGLTESALAGGAPLMPADHNLLLQQLRDGGVDAPEAVYTIQPFLQRELTTGRARTFSPAPSTTALNLKVMPVGTYHVNTRWLAKNGDTARRFFKAVYEAVDWMRLHDRETRSYLPDLTKGAVSAEMAQTIPLPVLWKPGEVDLKLYQKVLDLLHEHKALSKKLSARELYIRVPKFPIKGLE